MYIKEFVKFVISFFARLLKGNKNFRFLMRGYDEDKKRAENTRENRRSRDSREYNDRDYHRNERKKIKGRGRMHYKPQFSRSRSRYVLT